MRGPVFRMPRPVPTPTHNPGCAVRNAPATVVLQNLNPSPVTLQVADFAGTKLGLVKGGMPQSVQDPGGSRRSVGEFIQTTTGGVAGMNGTFSA